MFGQKKRDSKNVGNTILGILPEDKERKILTVGQDLNP